jgi:hypothetical protein
MDVNYLINQPEPEGVLTPEGQEQFTLLMSLSLDDLLDDAGQQHFQHYLERYPTLARQWRSWQTLDRHLTLAPSVEPSGGFVQRFEERLAQQGRRSLLGRNLWIAIFIILVWGGMLAGGVTLFAYVLLYQGSWLVGLVHNLAYYGAVVTQWLTTAWNTMEAWVVTPQAIAFALVYIVMSGALLVLWIRFLRHTTQSAEMASSG